MMNFIFFNKERKKIVVYILKIKPKILETKRNEMKKKGKRNMYEL